MRHTYIHTQNVGDMLLVIHIKPLDIESIVSLKLLTYLRFGFQTPLVNKWN